MGIGNILNMFDKLDDIIYEPIKMITDWAREPLKQKQFRRDQESELRRKEKEEDSARLNATIRMQEKQLDAEIELRNETGKQRVLSEIQQAEKDREVDRKKREAEIEVKKETEKVRILNEIEQLVKDQEFERMKSVSEALIKYQQDLTKINVEAINAIGNMQLELREKAQNLVYDKTIRYKELQDTAMRDAMEDLKRIHDIFGDSGRASDMLVNAVELRLGNVIKTADNFLIELNNDIKTINNSINLLAESGQKFIERHLDGFRAIGAANSDGKMINAGESIRVSYTVEPDEN